MKITRYFVFALVLIAMSSFVAYSQTTKKRPVKRTTTAPKTTTLPPLDVRAARIKVDNQLTNVGLFVKNFGPVAQALDAIEAESRTKRLSRQALDQNASDKQKVVTAIRGLREGMVKLESEFKVKPVLKKYLPMIQGISDLAGQSETSAIAAKFVAANAPLRTIQQKLTDTLAAMPDAEL